MTRNFLRSCTKRLRCYCYFTSSIQLVTILLLVTYTVCDQLYSLIQIGKMLKAGDKPDKNSGWE